jgi:tetratricopeptide (TPR) repeat protein
MNTQRWLITGSAVLGFALGMARGAERFDYTVRNDVFAGMTGDAAAMTRALEKIEATLAGEPNHAEAIVWRGGALFFQAGQAFQKQDQQKGMELYVRAMADFEKAGKLAPDHVGVLIPRAAVLMSAALATKNNPMAKDWVTRAVADYEHVRELQKDSFAGMGEHPRGELLQGLANGYRLLGDEAKASHYFERIQKELPNSAYAKRAAIWFETKTLTAAQSSCIGCHTAK